MDEIAEDLETANNDLIRNANKTSDWYASNLLRGNLSIYQTIYLNITVQQVIFHYTSKETPSNLQAVLSC